MGVGSVGVNGTSSKLKFSLLLNDVFAGGIASTLSVAYCLSYGALIFSGPLSHLLAYGVAVTFLSAAIGGTVVALRGSLPFAIAGPDSSISVVIAALVATVAQRNVAAGVTDLLAPTLIVMSLATAFTGITLCILGFVRAGRAIRFVPFPVIGGFLGATGWLLMTGASQVITDQRLTLANIGMLFDAAAAAKIAAAIAVAAALHLLMARSKTPVMLPAILLAGFAATYVVIYLSGSSVAGAQAGGWLFQPQPAATLMLPWKAEALRDFSWTALPSLAGDMLAILFVTISTLLLNTTGIEIATRSEAHIDRDLKVLGLANLLTAACGGYVSCTSLSRSILARTAGATGRLAGLTVAAVSVAMLVADPSLLGYVPKYLLGGLLIFLGSALVYQWMIQSSRHLLPIEYASLITIAFLIIYWGFVAGVLIGIVIGCATFALSASRVAAIKFNFDGSEYRSSLDRGPKELALLARHGREIQGMALQSYLFFGSANRLYLHVKALLAREPDCRFLIFDFRQVTGIDSSATQSFAQIRQAAGEAGARIVLVNLTPELERPFRTAQFISDDIVVAPDLDRALEACEQAIIEMHRSEAADLRSLGTWFTEVLGSTELADRLAGYCRRIEVNSGDIIARQGEPAASMHFILEGRIGVFVDLNEVRGTRVRSLGPHTTVGEMGLITRSVRSATIQAETPSILYELDADAFDRIKREQPALSQALLAYVIAVMSERLSFANRAIGVLQR